MEFVESLLCAVGDSRSCILEVVLVAVSQKGNRGPQDPRAREKPRLLVQLGESLARPGKRAASIFK